MDYSKAVRYVDSELGPHETNITQWRLFTVHFDKKYYVNKVTMGPPPVRGLGPLVCP